MTSRFKQGPEPPIDIKRDIARVVRSTPVVKALDGHAYRLFVGESVLKMLGFSPQRMVGGVLCRVGPDLRRDTVWLGDGRVAGHYWLSVGGEFVDFSVGDWKARVEGSPPDPKVRARLDWSVTLPEFFWGPPHQEPPRGGIPELGKIYFAAWMGKVPEKQVLAQLDEEISGLLSSGLLSIVKFLSGQWERDLAALALPERVKPFLLGTAGTAVFGPE